MKKQLFLSLLAILCISSSFAQNQMQEHQNHDREMSENYTPSNNSKSVGGWFNYGKEIETLSIDLNSYGSVIHPDSTMLDAYIDDNNDTIYYNITRHSRGQILDPTSFNFYNTGNAEAFIAGEGFILDTIYFPYQYLRPQTQNPDKLIVQIYSTENNAISEGSFTSGGSFWNVEYDASINQGKNAFQTIEYDLTDNDETHPDSVRYQEFIVNPPLNIPGGGLVAVTYTFVPGNPYNTGDTLATAEISTVVNPRNSFIVLYSTDKDPATISDPHVNYNLTVFPGIQYGTSGWDGQYYPGNAWTSGGDDIMIHDNIWFHLTSIPLSTTNFNATNIKLYPNPAKDKMNIVFNNTNDVNSMKITDVTGRVVHTENIASNANSIEVNTKNYPAGIYFCEINGETTNETLKFTKIK
jgi:hypothetical protein